MTGRSILKRVVEGLPLAAAAAVTIRLAATAPKSGRGA